MTATLRKGKKRAVFLSVGRLATYNLASLVKPGEKCYKELVGLGPGSTYPDSIRNCTVVQVSKQTQEARRISQYIHCGTSFVGQILHFEETTVLPCKETSLDCTPGLKSGSYP